MKAGHIAIVALSIAAAAAQPHHRHQHHDKRKNVVVDFVTDYVTDVTTATQPAAIVFVDPNGEPVSTSYNRQSAPTEAAYPNPPSSNAALSAPTTDTSSPRSAPTSSTEGSYIAPAAVSTTSGSAPSAYSPSAASSASSSAGSGISALGRGITYNPYTQYNGCKTQDQVSSDFDVFGSDGYGIVRIYGTDCDQVSTVLNAASQKGMKVFAGVFDLSNTASEVNTIIDSARNNWDAIDTISIGNEALLNGADPLLVVGQVNLARGMLQTAGYNGKIVSVDDFNELLETANQGVGQASDYISANCHAFFADNVNATQAGDFVQQQFTRLQQKYPGKDVVITESGWPSNGDANGAAIPNPENQQAAIASLKNSFSSNLFLFDAFNDPWKSNYPGTFNAEQWWGVYGNSAYG